MQTHISKQHDCCSLANGLNRSTCNHFKLFALHIDRECICVSDLNINVKQINMEDLF